MVHEKCIHQYDLLPGPVLAISLPLIHWLWDLIIHKWKFERFLSVPSQFQGHCGLNRGGLEEANTKYWPPPNIKSQFYSWTHAWTQEQQTRQCWVGLSKLLSHVRAWFVASSQVQVGHQLCLSYNCIIPSQSPLETRILWIAFWRKIFVIFLPFKCKC